MDRRDGARHGPFGDRNRRDSTAALDGGVVFVSLFSGARIRALVGPRKMSQTRESKLGENNCGNDVKPSMGIR
jgi:hypothetical protein